MSAEPVDTFYVHVGDKLRFQRKKAGIDQETFSKHLNLSRTTVINIEKGRQRLSLEHAWLAARILDISLETLLPLYEDKSVIEWESEVKKMGVNKRNKKALIDWISKAKSS